MKKEEFIKKYGEVVWERRLAQRRAYSKTHRVQERARSKRYHEDHLEQERARNQEASRKGGKYYDLNSAYNKIGLRCDRRKIRNKHQKWYKPYKDITAPDSQLHHNWIPGTAEYTGLALVEADQHMHGFIKVIEVLDGEITLFSEEDIKMGKGEK